MTARTIPLDAVRTVLMCEKARRRAGTPLARTAAYTRREALPIDCRTARRGYARHACLGVHFAPMTSGDLSAVLERTRLHHGLAEVRAIWGRGLRALRAEFERGEVLA
jgi:hypothetical protein